VIECTYWDLTTSYSESLAIAQEVNLQILEQFNAENIDFAFPTVTINGIDSDVFAKSANENTPRR
jgi:small-conductance mechanosensitive channel